MGRKGKRGVVIGDEIGNWERKGSATGDRGAMWLEIWEGGGGGGEGGRGKRGVVVIVGIWRQ